MKKQLIKSAVLPILLLLSASPVFSQPIQIGVAGAVRGHVMAIAAKFGAVGRVMESGKLVFHKDRVISNAEGRMQVMLADETVFTLGPNSEMVLDEFIYDPKTSRGKVAVRMTKGVLRFVTGKIARKNPSNMKIKLPVGTIGIRGTIAAVRVDGLVSMVVLLGPGPDNNTSDKRGGLVISHAGNSVEIWKPGFGTIVRPGHPPMIPFKLTPAQMARLDPVGLGDAHSGLKDAVRDAVAESQTTGAQSRSSSDEDLSGQSAASALGDLSDTESLESFTTTLSNEVDDAAQRMAQAGLMADGVASWDAVRSIPTGQGHYSGIGSDFLLSQCYGGACFGQVAGEINVNINIDFGARTLGGDCGGACGSSYIAVSAWDQGDTSISANIAVPVASFASLTGQAVLTFQGGGRSGDTTTATLSLLNSGGEAASLAHVDAVYDDGSHKAAGGITVPLQDGVLVRGDGLCQSGCMMEKMMRRPW